MTKMAETGNNSTNSDYAWLNNAFIETILRSGEENANIKVKSFEVGPATAVGDNYASDMSRVRVRFIKGQQEETKSLIFKRGPKQEVTLKVQMHRLLEEVSPGKFPPFSAKHLYSNCDQSIPAIVLEDLKEQGFRLADRIRGLDVKHCTLALRALARYNAASAVLHKNNPKILEPFYESAYNEVTVSHLKGIFEEGIRNVASEVEKWPGYNDRFAKKLFKVAEQCMDFLVNSTIRDDQEFNALTHGDFWSCSLQFLAVKRRVCWHRSAVEDHDSFHRGISYTLTVQLLAGFVDYQFCQFANPAHDIIYFLYTSPTLDIMKDSQFLIEDYYRTLEETLTLLGHKELVPSFSDFMKQLNRKGLLAVIMATVGMSFVYAESDNIPDTEGMMKGQQKQSRLSKPHEEAMKAFTKMLLKASILVSNIEEVQMMVKVSRGSREEETALIVKIARGGEEHMEESLEGSLFQRENLMYGSTLPHFHQILNEAIGCSSSTKPFFPRCIYTQLEPTTAIILEDLKGLNYQMIERGKALDLIHCSLVIKKLAEFHAASVALKKAYPDSLDHYQTSVYCEEMRQNYEPFFVGTMKALVEEVKTWPGYSDKVIKKLIKLSDTAADRIIKILQPNFSEFTVLNHGDLWSNNIMFKYSEYSEVTDLSYIMEKLNLKPPSLDELNNAFNEKALYGVVTACVVLPLVLADGQAMDEEAAPGKYQPLAAACLHNQDIANRTVIVIEDLKVQGFKMAQRRLGLSLDHCVLVMKMLARLHGTSIAFSKKDPTLIESFNFKDINKESTGQGMFAQSVKSLANEVETWLDDDKRFAGYPERLRKCATECEVKIREIKQMKEDELNVLTHGDCWVNNIMFRFVDFQFSYWTSPVIDLLYFLYTNPQPEVWDKHNFLLEEYHDELGTTMQLLGIEHLLPTFEELCQLFESKLYYGFFASLVLIPFVLRDPNNIIGLPELIKENETVTLAQKNMHSNSQMLSVFQRILPMFAEKEQKGVSNWCNKMFLENALQQGLNKPNIHVVNFEIEKATASGDNYLSDMFRVSLKTIENGRDNNISLIIKCSPQEENTEKFVSELNMFWREYQALKMVIPKFHNQLEAVAPGRYQPFASTCLIHQNIDKISVIVLDDLKTQGFKMANRLLGFDLQHCILVLKNLARLHAASASLYDKDPSFTDIFNKKPTVDNKRTTDFFSDLLISLADEIDTWEEDKEYKQYSQRLRNCVPTCGKKNKEALQISDQGINLSHWCSPAADLLYFLFTSPHPDLWDKHDLLLEEYHNELGNILQILGLSHLHPSFQELKDEIEKRYFYGLFASVAILPLVLRDPDNAVNVDDILGTDGTSQQKIHSGAELKRAYKKFLPLFAQKHVL
ncbi:hypothetical protein C0J52_16997 [Blattella germanica]|nr:hypothetical protein C0J52_16997 [Blattella germanica]